MRKDVRCSHPALRTCKICGDVETIGELPAFGMVVKGSPLLSSPKRPQVAERVVQVAELMMPNLRLTLNWSSSRSDTLQRNTTVLVPVLEWMRGSTWLCVCANQCSVADLHQGMRNKMKA